MFDLLLEIFYPSDRFAEQLMLLAADLEWGAHGVIIMYTSDIEAQKMASFRGSQRKLFVRF